MFQIRYRHYPETTLWCWTVERADGTMIDPDQGIASIDFSSESAAERALKLLQEKFSV